MDKFSCFNQGKVLKKLFLFKNKESLRFSSRGYALETGYQPSQVERNWQDIVKNSSSGTQNDYKPKFTMILPPPNVTGNLHLGHALMCTIQDVICRRKRQEGYDVLWIPGTDHAGIATQVVVEKKLLKEVGMPRHKLGREKFLEEIWKWKNEKKDSIVRDMQRMGSTVSWEREYFTMDENQAAAVTEAFIRLFERGVIKRKNSLVNWSCYLESSISDVEVETLELNGPTDISVPGYEKNIRFGQIFDIAYKLQDSDEEIVVSTTRPETLLGDVAVAVNPLDGRYTKYIPSSVEMKKLWHPLRNEPIPLVFDVSVDSEFGTGAVKITPAHDKNDFELAKKHLLPSMDVITTKGTINYNFTDFAGLQRFEAREKMLNVLSDMGLLKGIRSHAMKLPICQRSRDVIEYLQRPQWFFETTEIAQDAVNAVKSGNLKIIPTNFETEWFRWLNECRDWCISRQLWWGHQIPAYNCASGDKNIWIAAQCEEQALEKAAIELKVNRNNIEIKRDEDVLDTWFSSALLPLSALGWPSNKNYTQFYPLDLMETGHDIIFFWVARMVMMGIALNEKIPFRNILLHGIVCDAHGRKMSKSLGNVILPDQVISGATFEDLKSELKKSVENGTITKEELLKSLEGLKKLFSKGIPECGTDALRFTLCSHNIKNHFINFDVSECNTNRLFFNKIWQATRYTLGACEKQSLDPKKLTVDNSLDLKEMDYWILSKLANMRKICNQSFNNYNFHLATIAIKTFFYANLCDVYLETTKPEIAKCPDRAKASCAVLSACLSLGLETMLPITPFLCNELQKYVPSASKVVDINLSENEQLDRDVDIILEVCQSIRQLKSQYNICKKHEPKVHLFPEGNESMKLLCRYKDIIKTLSLTTDVLMENNLNGNSKKKFDIFSTAWHVCSFGISTNNEFKKRELDVTVNDKKLLKLQKILLKLTQRISAEGYKNGASQSVQEAHLEKLKNIELEIRNIEGIKS